MTQLVTTTEMQAISDYTIETVGIAPAVLTERAALATLEVLGASSFHLENVLVLVGLGSNGADGLAVARLLHQQGVPVTIQFVGNVHRANEAVKEQLAIAEAVGVPRSEKSDFNQASLIIDAIFGTGLNNALPEGLQKMIKAANHIGKPVLALDLPTGIDPNSGQILGAALNASTTVSFGYQKIGTTKEMGPKIAGQVVVKDSGFLSPNQPSD
ncbi:NAD(P)H-hydrate epimerase [Leuconostocaceae bacterium ESL0958]|nr:NAD(P)H-hydrate epimerase [Leuconostocaceae bacterium ESL0958]